MILWIIVFIYTTFVLLIIGLGYFKQQETESTYYTGQKIKMDELTVLIPYRNEQENLPKLLNCLENSNIQPKQIIFIDDHSTDKSASLLSERKTNHYQLLCLKDKYGKKEALRLGISHAKGEFILTLDADILLKSGYFHTITQLEEADIYLFPVVLKGKNFLQVFFELDLLMVNALNSGLFGWHRPIIASGANLLFRKEMFLRSDKYDTHKHILSGDDIYLLRDFRHAKADVRLVLNNDVTVISDTPFNLSSFFHQRIRWIAKTSHVKDHFATFLGVFQGLMIISFCSCFFYYLVHNETKSALILFLMKTIIDLLGFAPYFVKVRAQKQLLYLIPYQFIYPIYLIIIGILLPFFRPVWKQRLATVKAKSN